MGALTSQITSLPIVFSRVSLDTHQRKHQSSASLASVWGIHRRPVNSPHKWPVTRKMFPFDHVIMNVASCSEVIARTHICEHDDIMKRKHFQHSLHKGQWCRASYCFVVSMGNQNSELFCGYDCFTEYVHWLNAIWNNWFIFFNLT